MRMGVIKYTYLKAVQHGGVPVVLKGCQMLVVLQHLCCSPLHLLRLCSLQHPSHSGTPTNSMLTCSAMVDCSRLNKRAAGSQFLRK